LGICFFFIMLLDSHLERRVVVYSGLWYMINSSFNFWFFKLFFSLYNSFLLFIFLCFLFCAKLIWIEFFHVFSFHISYFMYHRTFHAFVFLCNIL
jgi:hypothetical protein